MQESRSGFTVRAPNEDWLHIPSRLACMNSDKSATWSFGIQSHGPEKWRTPSAGTEKVDFSIA